MQLTSEFVVDALVAFAMIGGGILSSWRLSWVLVGEGAISLRWAATYVIGVLLATVGFFILHPLGLFERKVALVGVSAAVGFACLPRRDLSLRELLLAERLETRRLWRALSGSPFTWAATFFLPFVLLRWAWVSVNPTFGWDGMTYHGPRALLLAQNTTFTFDSAPHTWSIYRHYFVGWEVLAAWAVLPFRGDTLLSFMGGIQWLGVGLGTWALGRALRLDHPRALLVAGCGMFLPAGQYWVGLGYVEPLMNGLLLCSAALALSFLRGALPERGALALAGIGASVGVKLLAAFAGAVLGACVVATALLCRRHRRRRTAGILLVGALVGLLPFAPSMAHSYVETGYPLNSFDVEIAGVRLGEGPPYSQWNAGRQDHRAYRWPAERSTLRMVFRGFGGPAKKQLGPFAALALLLAALGCALAACRRHWSALSIFAVLAAHVGAQYLPHVTDIRLNPQDGSIARYAQTAVLLGLPLAALAARRMRTFGDLLLWLLFLGFAYYAIHYAEVSIYRFEARQILEVAAGMVLVGGFTWMAARLGAPAAATAFLVAALFFTADLDARADAHRYRARRSPQTRHITYWLPAAEALDDPDTPHRIAITGGQTPRVGNWFTYYFFGSRLQNQLSYVPITEDGSIAPHGRPPGRRRLASKEAWLRRIEEEGITHVVAFHPPSIELTWMSADSERFRSLARGSGSGVYRVADAEREH